MNSFFRSNSFPFVGFLIESGEDGFESGSISSGYNRPEAPTAPPCNPIISLEDEKQSRVLKCFTVFFRIEKRLREKNTELILKSNYRMREEKASGA